MNPPPPDFICSLCRRRTYGDGIVRTLLVDGCTRPGGRFCSPGCVHAADAADAVRELQRDDEIADLLLDLWRRGRGPKPSTVGEAARRAALHQKRLVASGA